MQILDVFQINASFAASPLSLNNEHEIRRSETRAFRKGLILSDQRSLILIEIYDM